MVDESNIFLNCTYKTDIELLTDISNKLIKNGYVKKSFTKSILDREKIYPTALKLDKFGIAIPHTDSENVLKSGIAFVKLNENCEFKEMCTNKDVEVNMAFILLVKDKKKQVDTLTKLMNLFSKNDILEKLYNEENKISIAKILNNEIK